MRKERQREWKSPSVSLGWPRRNRRDRLQRLGGDRVKTRKFTLILCVRVPCGCLDRIMFRMGEVEIFQDHLFSLPLPLLLLFFLVISLLFLPFIILLLPNRPSSLAQVIKPKFTKHKIAGFQLSCHGVHSMLCNYHCHPVPIHARYSKVKPQLLPNPISPGNHQSNFCHLGYIKQEGSVSQEWGHVIHGPFQLTPFTQHGLGICLHYGLHQSSTFSSVDRPPFVSTFIHRWTPGLFSSSG